MRRAASHRERGFTVIELMAAIGIFAAIMGIGMVKIGELRSQTRGVGDLREVGMTLGTLRAEAIRLRQPVRVHFTTAGFEWDIHDDGTTDGSTGHTRGVAWSGGVPADLVFNGLGLVRGIATDRTLTLTSGGHRASLTINRNGFLKF
jgi:prepilin-type N-terminal cleavage/methylation domain-containing protein